MPYVPSIEMGGKRLAAGAGTQIKKEYTNERIPYWVKLQNSTDKLYFGFLRDVPYPGTPNPAYLSAEGAESCSFAAIWLHHDKLLNLFMILSVFWDGTSFPPRWTGKAGSNAPPSLKGFSSESFKIQKKWPKDHFMAVR